ncbi:replication initiation protein [Piscirickettsia salmonis]|uniref:replication initiation protein n=1 Tax=Piscirickettsia salmonis TaxID=1238 RepID=UPI0018AC9EE5|nr:replication initiation protein [Piscirickettsia salmonis]QGP57180.1 replication protein [Piscirickettsia salmonis]
MSKSKKIVVKSNKLIEAGYKLSLQEQRVLLLCISQINSKNVGLSTEYTITAQQYADQYSIALKGAYRELKAVINTLYDRSVSIYDKQNDIEISFRWLSEKVYLNKQGTARVRFSERVEPFLTDLKSKFTSYDLNLIAGIKSSYAIRVYELLKQFGAFGERTVTLDWLKGRLEINDEKSYKMFGSVKQRILEPAKSEINRCTDISMDYKPVKTGRKVTHISFIFESKRKDIVRDIKEEKVDKKVSVAGFIKGLNLVIDTLENSENINRNKLSFAYNKFVANGTAIEDYRKLLDYIASHSSSIKDERDIESVIGEQLYLGKKKSKPFPPNWSRVTNPLSQSYYHEHNINDDPVLEAINGAYEVIGD